MQIFKTARLVKEQLILATLLSYVFLFAANSVQDSASIMVNLSAGLINIYLLAKILITLYQQSNSSLAAPSELTSIMLKIFKMGVWTVLVLFLPLTFLTIGSLWFMITDEGSLELVTELFGSATLAITTFVLFKTSLAVTLKLTTGEDISAWSAFKRSNKQNSSALIHALVYGAILFPALLINAIFTTDIGWVDADLMKAGAVLLTTPLAWLITISGITSINRPMTTLSTQENM